METASTLKTNQGPKLVTSSPAFSNDVFRLSDRSSELGKKIWTAVFDLPGEKVNKFDEKVMNAFESLLGELENLGRQGKIDALVVQSGKQDNFIAGADIKLFQAAKTADEAEKLSAHGQKLLNRWEDLPFVTVVAVNGTCLGGGCEFSLASSAIVMSDAPSAKIGLPEVLLGVLPGMGGCVRMPTKVGIATALDMILTGKTLDGTRAFKSGLVDALIPQQDFEHYAHIWVAKNLPALKEGKRLGKEPKLGGMGGMGGKVLEGTPFGRAMIFKKAREGVLSKTKGQYPAPLRAIDTIKAIGNGYGPKLKGERRAKALSIESKAFGELAVTPVCKNLIRLFFLTESVKKANGLFPYREMKGAPVKAAAVLGAGVMGGGIAHLFANKNTNVRMKDLTNEALAIGVKAAEKLFKKDAKKRKINQRQYLQKLNHIGPTTDYSGFQSADLVVEAIVENMDIKKKVLQELEGKIKSDCVVASNTSSLSINEMQKVMQKPERFAGMHFFNPVHLMPLIEVIRGEKTSDQTVVTVFELSKKLGKTPIVVKDSAGFLVNRLLCPYLNESTFMLADGGSVEEIDKALLQFGMPMGPLELIDEVGVDVGEKVLNILYKAFGERMKPAQGIGKVVAAKRLGKKSGQGIYLWKDGKKNLDPSIYQLLGLTPVSGKISAQEMVERSIYPMINEAARCLEEGVVSTPSDVDLGMIMGTGFPPFRGGLLRYADQVGAKTVVDTLDRLTKKYGIRFEPAPVMRQRAQKGETFYKD